MTDRIQSLIVDYGKAKDRCRYLKHLPKEYKRKPDIDRILFSRGQDNTFSADELYACFDGATRSRYAGRGFS